MCASLKPLRVCWRSSRWRSTRSSCAFTFWFVWNLEDPADERPIHDALAPDRTEVPVEQLHPRPAQERRHVHAVGHETYGVLAGRHVGPARLVEPRRHAAVDLADAVDRGRAADRELGHAEAVALLRRAAEVEELLRADPERGRIGLELLGHAVERKDVVAGAHGRVGREHGARGRGLHRRVERQAARRELAQPLDHGESRVPLVHVPDGGLQVQCPQRAHPADAEHGLLVHPKIAADAVEHVRDLAVVTRVLVDVGVEQQHEHAAHRGLPHADRDRAVRDWAAHANLFACAVDRNREREVARVDRRIVWNLLAVAVDALIEIALPVEQPHGDERQPQIARRLAVIARENAEAARVDREALLQAVLGAEIRDQVRRLEILGLGPAGARIEISVELRDDVAVCDQKCRVLGGTLEDPLVDAFQEQLRVALATPPEQGVELPKQLARGRIPAEQEVLREIGEPTQGLRQRRGNQQGEQRARHVLSLSRRCTTDPWTSDRPSASRG